LAVAEQPAPAGAPPSAAVPLAALSALAVAAAVAPTVSVVRPVAVALAAASRPLGLQLLQGIVDAAHSALRLRPARCPRCSPDRGSPAARGARGTAPLPPRSAGGGSRTRPPRPSRTRAECR